MARRGRPPTLSRERVLAAAVELVDADGIGALTMRTLAASLEVEAMSLYHYVPHKEALLDGLVESVLAEVAAEVERAVTDGRSAGRDWRDVVRTRSLAARDVMVRHPWTPALISSRSVIPPSVFAHYEVVLAAMVEAGASYALGHKAVHALGSMALGFVQEMFVPAAGAESASEEMLAEMAARFPHLTAMVASEIHAHDGDVLGWCDSREEFEFTLDLLLDGLEARRVASLPRGAG